MSKNNVIELSGRKTGNDPLTKLLRADAECLFCQVMEADLPSIWPPLDSTVETPDLTKTPFLLICTVLPYVE